MGNAKGSSPTARPARHCACHLNESSFPQSRLEQVLAWLEHANAPMALRSGNHVEDICSR